MKSKKFNMLRDEDNTDSLVSRYKNRLAVCEEYNNLIRNSAIDDIQIKYPDLIDVDKDFLSRTAEYLNSINVYINDSIIEAHFGSIGSENSRLKKSILDTITLVAGAVLSYGKGLHVSDYRETLQGLINNLDPDDIIQ